MTETPAVPFEPPPFSRPSKIEYVWWSWHPCYPRWSKSCWKADSEEAAWDLFNNKASLECYHNKLIREGDGQFIEVADQPTLHPGIWWKIYQQIRDGTRTPEAGLVVPDLGDAPKELLSAFRAF